MSDIEDAAIAWVNADIERRRLRKEFKKQYVFALYDVESEEELDEIRDDDPGEFRILPKPEPEAHEYAVNATERHQKAKLEAAYRAEGLRRRLVNLVSKIPPPTPRRMNDDDNHYDPR